MLPFVAFFDPTDQSSLNNIAGPFCILSKSCAWRTERVFNNDVEDDIDKKHTITKGVSESQSTGFSHSAGVDISASAGFFGVSFEVSLNYQFTYEQHYKFTEYYEKEEETRFCVAPFSAKVIFTRFVFLK